MGDHTAFFYGTLMARQVLYRVLWRDSNPPAAYRNRLTINPAILHSYCRHKVHRADYPGIIPQEGKSVLGVYVTGLTDANIYNLDVFEGDQYKREKVKVKLLEGAQTDVQHLGSGGIEGEEVVAETYVFHDKDDLVEEEWNFQEFVKEKMWRWADNSVEYDEVDEAAEQNGHDPTGGRAVNGDMNSKLTGTEREEIIESAV